MKHLSAGLLMALCLMLALSPIAHANITVDWDIEGLHGDTLHPGRVYMFPLLYNGYQIEQGENTGYAYRVTTDPKLSGVSASIVTENRRQWVRVSVSAAAQADSYIEVILTVTDRRDRSYTYDESWVFDIGYGDAYYVSGDTHELFDDETVLEFGDQVSTCYIYLPEGSEFIANLQPNSSRNRAEGRNRIIDFYYSTDMIYEVESRYGSRGLLEYMRFYTDYNFNQSLLRFFAPGANYVYEIDGLNNLTRIPATRNGDFLVISTTRLGSYVLSDNDLGVGYASIEDISSGESTPALPPAPTPSPGYTVPVTGGDFKTNPGTGVAA
jgi:hypothetical protein